MEHGNATHCGTDIVWSYVTGMAGLAGLAGVASVAGVAGLAGLAGVASWLEWAANRGFSAQDLGQKKIDPFRGRVQRLPDVPEASCIPIKYRNCNFFSVS
jgi:hypothetical protein